LRTTQRRARPRAPTRSARRAAARRLHCASLGSPLRRSRVRRARDARARGAQVAFKREVAETFLRCVSMGFDQARPHLRRWARGACPQAAVLVATVCGWKLARGKKPHGLEFRTTFARGALNCTACNGAHAAPSAARRSHAARAAGEQGGPRRARRVRARRQDLAVIELNGLKIAEDRSFADCARYILTTVLALCGPAPPRTRAEYAPLFSAAAPVTDTPVRARLRCTGGARVVRSLLGAPLCA